MPLFRSLTYAIKTFDYCRTEARTNIGQNLDQDKKQQQQQQKKNIVSPDYRYVETCLISKSTKYMNA